MTGEVGTGKTTVVRTLLSRVPHHADVAVILNPRVTPVEFLLTICEELGLPIEAADRRQTPKVTELLHPAVTLPIVFQPELRRALELVHSGKVQVLPFLTHRYHALDQVQGAFENDFHKEDYIKGQLIRG